MAVILPLPQWIKICPFSLTGGTSNITSHTFALAKYVYMHLKQFRHGNGLPVARLYEDTGYVSMATQGPIIAFNLLRPDGAYIGCSQVRVWSRVI